LTNVFRIKGRPKSVTSLRHIGDDLYEGSDGTHLYEETDGDHINIYQFPDAQLRALALQELSSGQISLDNIPNDILTRICTAKTRLEAGLLP
jgi:hypothetical protein